MALVLSDLADRVGKREKRGPKNGVSSKKTGSVLTFQHLPQIAEYFDVHYMTVSRAVTSSLDARQHVYF